MRRPDPVDPRLARLLTAARLDRRGFLRSLGLGSGVLLGGGALSACGIGGGAGEGGNGAATGTPTGTSGVTGTGVTGTGTQAAGGELNFSNWTLYIDVDEEDQNVRPTLQQFTEETGIAVNYFEDINSNDEYFAKIRTQLDAGEDIGRDLIVLTDWMAGRLVEFGWLSKIDHANVPNIANLRSALQDVPFDPERRFSLPWQSGMTGIGYNPEIIGREIASVNDLFDPALSGQVTFLSEMRDTMGLMLAAEGVDPSTHEFSQYEAAIERLREAVGSGQVRAFTGNDYAADLAAGNIGAAIAWSGDVIQSQFENPDIQFVLPAEGAMLWSDNMLIPANAQNKANAEALMDFVYRPEIAAQIAAWVNYITPVEGAREAITEIDPELAENELIFPSAETLDNTHDFKQLDEEEERAYQELFQSVIGA